MDTHSIRERFSHKIKSIDEVRAVVGVYPREKSVVMCHGTFDVVHPGHLRHLLYAKSKADVLVVSVTADVHVSKGELRPHVPQDLRAASLAAYEFVDFVVIDGNATPIENLRTCNQTSLSRGLTTQQA